MNSRPALRSAAVLALCGLALLFAATPALAASKRPPPRSFFGVVPQEAPTGTDLNRMRGVVGTVRLPILWAAAEPRPGEYDLSSFDRQVRAAARRGLRVLPFVFGSPSWLRSAHAFPPHTTARGRAEWSDFLRHLVRRYGPRGTIWRAARAHLPIRSWQIWNEPNFRAYWLPRPSAGGYVRLLRVSRRAIRGVDRGARIVAGGVAPVEQGMAPVGFLARMYRVPGARRAFDVAALHPYATAVPYVAIYVRRARRAMARAGDGAKPLRVTEMGVASDGKRRSGYDRGPDGQAVFLYRAYRMLTAMRGRWRIAGVDWFSWRDTTYDNGECVFCQYSGLFGARGRPKPAWEAMRAVSAAAGPRVR